MTYPLGPVAKVTPADASTTVTVPTVYAVLHMRSIVQLDSPTGMVHEDEFILPTGANWACAVPEKLANETTVMATAKRMGVIFISQK